MAKWSQMVMQDSVSPSMSYISGFHDYMMLTMVLVLSIIGYVLISLCLSHLTNRYILEAQEVETVWTVVPAIILITMAVPSIQILYMVDEVVDPKLTIKVIGHQWYWSYQYGDFPFISFDSYMLPIDELKLSDYRLLEVDDRLVLPMKQEIRMVVSSADVIHSWTVPSMGVKLDAVPGRLNQVSMFMLKPGVYYGQCSEICGVNHSFMPICIESISSSDFILWVKKY
uniref:Cytochrome c oxidase subunit 2 n=1 Tax=Whitmania acranulata TaxID=1329092 RepID=X2CBT8_WHICA|nr:cytochrome c oxidase subunit II [Whitmania acranulata]AGL34615.1 cytochrome c oxidase subunit II [Whitmania acranulata]QIC20349.1 cytochrome c oxidase subunit II [Whitmania acranulata]